MEEDKKLEKRKNIEIVVLLIIIVALLGSLIYLLFIKKDKLVEPSKTQDNHQVVDNDQELKKSLEEINEEVTKLLHTETTVEKFEQHAKKYFTNDMISELIKYYDKNTKTVCLDSAACYASGGFFGETTDIEYRKFEITSVENDVIKAKGIYGEAENNITGETEILYQKESGVWKIEKFDISDFSNEGVYKTLDGKFTFRDDYHMGETTLNGQKFNCTDVEYDERYAFYSGYFEGEERQDDYHFLIDKEKGIIVEKDYETVRKLNNKDLRFYGDSDLSKFNTFFKCSAGYFFVSYLGGPLDEGDVKIVSIYTTDWKELGYIDLNNVKSDKSGIFVYENYDDNYKLSGTAIKYDANGNKIN